MAISLIKEEEDHILRVLPILLKKDDSFRGQVYAILSETFATKEDLKKILEEIQQNRQESNRRFEAIDRRFEALIQEIQQNRQESNRRFEAIDRRFEAIDRRFEAIDRRFEALIQEIQQNREESSRRFEALTQEMHLEFESIRKELHLRISTIGSRWGKKAEATFRNALKELLAKKLEVKQIERWQTFDEEGKVFSTPSSIEADILIRNDKHWIVEVKSSVDKAEVGAFERMANLYKEKTNIIPGKILVAIAISKTARNLCEKLGIEIVSYEDLEEVDEDT